jgi:putative SOS response-associated peptidase YedK
MCNDFGNNIPYSDYLAAFSQTRIPVQWPSAAPNLESREDIWPTDPTPVIRRLEDGRNEFAVLRWGFPPVGEEWFCFVGLWRPMPDGTGDAFTLPTTKPGPDVAPIHDRQMVVLERDDWAAWLDLTKPEATLLRPLPAGALQVEQVR